MYDTTCGGPNYTLYDFNIQTNNVAEGVTVDQSHTTYNASGCDSITRMHLLIHQPVTTNIAASVCQGDEYNLNGFNVTSIQTQSVGTTSYTQNLHTVNNCDSTVILTLTVNEVKSTSLTDAVCKGGVYTDYNFVIKTKDSVPGTYTYIKNLKTAKGCDSTVTLTLTINLPITENFNDAITAGNNYIGYGFNTHSDTLAPGTYTFSSTYHTSDGCDSVVILTLVVNNPAQTTTIYDTVCHGIGIYGNYDFSINTTGLAEGTYTHTRAIGDSTVILYLTVKPTITVDIYDTVCGGANYMLHGFNIVTANIADGTIIEQTNNNYTAGGCDSATTLHLVIHQADTTWLTATVCQGDEYNLYGFNVTSIETGTAGTTTYTQNLSTQYTCDSTVILTLTVNEVKSTTLTDAICKGGVYTDYGFVIKTKDSMPGTFNYVRTLKTAQGCDSTITLSLTIDNPIETNFNEVILVGTSYIGHGFVTQSDTLPAGSYTYTNKFHTPEGCDSIVILTLVINNPASTTILYDTVCHGVGIYSNYDFTITTTGLAPGTYLHTHYLTDSTVHLYLTINQPILQIYYDTICSGENYSKYGFNAQAADLSIGLNTFNSLSTYTADGCDSSATLYLTVNKKDTTYITANVCKNQVYNDNGFNITTTDSAGIFTYQQDLTNTNNCDSTVILQLTVNEIYNTIINESVCKGGVYTDNGFIIKTKDSLPNTYQYTRNLQTTTGCDSIITLNLTIDNPIETIFNESILVGTNYIGHGFVTGSDTLPANIYTFSNTYHTPDGCDSVVTLTLTVNNPAQTITLYDTVCHGIGYYTNYDFTINTTGLAAGTYLHTHLLVDSTVNLYLTVNPTIEADIYDTVCAGPNYGKYDFAIVTNTLPEGTYDYTHSSYTPTGCDSITNLHLTIHQTKTTNITDVICQGEEYLNWGFNITSAMTQNAGTFTFQQNLLTSFNCDSTVILTLTVNEVKSTTLSDAICKGAVYTDYGFIIKTKDSIPGIYNYVRTLKTINGCDSTVTLNLTIDAPIENNIVASITIGESYIANGFAINSDTAGIGIHNYTQIHHTAEGCDSIVNLTLTINSLVPMTILYDSICHGGFYFNNGLGIYVPTSDSLPGTYSFTRDYIDSVVILYLTINAPETTDIYDSICLGENYNANGFNLTTNTLAAGNYTYQRTIFLAGACENIINLHLTINSPSTTTLSDEVCQNSPYTSYGFNITGAQNSVPGTYTHTLNLKNKFGCDSTVTLTLTVTPESIVNLSDNICKGEVYINNGFAIITKDSAAGTYNYTQNLKTVKGCDSIITLALTINPTYSTVIYDTICQGGTYSQFGFNENTAGVYTQSLQTAKGCDSIITLNLFVNPTFTTNLTATICQGDSYTQNGFNEDSAGVYTQNLQTVNGCDSIVTLTLIVNPVYNIALSDEICKGEVYVGNGFTVITKDSAAGTYSYTQNLKTKSGCDSIVTLNLTVNPIYSTVIYDTICQGGTYSQFGFNENTAGVYTQSLQTAKGCDSIITLNLFVNPTFTTNLTATICQGDSYTQNGFNEDSAGVYTQNLQTVNGCDSIVTLTLIVNPVYNIALSDEICKGEVYVGNGFTVITKDSAAGTYSYTQNLKTKSGCDSIVTLNLTVTPTYNITIYDTICQNALPYTQHGFNASQTGIYTKNLTTATGCDSVVTLNLLVNSNTTTTLYDEVCQGESYHNYNFSITSNKTQVAGVYNYMKNLQTTTGCDSVVRLILTVNPNKTQTVYDNVCHGDVYIGFGFAIRTEDSIPAIYTYVQNLQTSKGCDSVVTLVLTINPVYNTMIYDTICQGETYSQYGFNENTAGIFTQNLTTVKGCDSIITLNLFVNPVKQTNLTATICYGETYTENGFNEFEPGTYTQNLQTVNGCDSIVSLTLYLNPVKQTYINDTVCQGDVYINSGFAIKTADSAAGNYTYTQNLVSAAGCDSIVTLTLTINQSYNIQIWDSIYSGSVYAKNSFSVSVSGTYTQTLQTGTGCDSTVTLHLTVKPNTDTRTECDKYEWNDITYTKSGTYTQTVQTQDGIDSTIILTLIITHSSTGDVYATSCDTFTWFDSTYYASGNYTHTLIGGNSEGCDSIITLHLTILKTTYADIPFTACEEYRWEIADTTYYESGDYVFVMSNAAGCDSIITLHLTINQPSIVNIEDSSINDYTWEINGETYTESGVYSYTIYGGAENGCDSTIILTLTIKEPDGIGDIAAETVAVTAYPNPASDHIDLRVESAETYNNARYQLFDVIGKLVTNGNIEAEVTRIATVQLAPGTYFLRVILANDDIRTLKVVKR